MNTGLKHHISTGLSSKYTYHGVKYPGSCVLSNYGVYKTCYPGTRRTKFTYRIGGWPGFMRSLSRVVDPVYPITFPEAKSVRNFKLLLGLEPRIRQLYKLLRVSKVYQGELFLGEAFMDMRWGIVTSWRCSHLEQKTWTIWVGHCRPKDDTMGSEIMNCCSPGIHQSWLSSDLAAHFSHWASGKWSDSLFSFPACWWQLLVGGGCGVCQPL